MPFGMPRALQPGVGARTYRDLEAWQLADDLRREVIAFTAKIPASTDFRFCKEIRGTAGSVCRNLAEGFGRRHPREFAQYARIVLGSLAELQDQLIEAHERRYLSDGDLKRRWALSERVRQTTQGLRVYLERSATAGARRKSPMPSTARTAPNGE